MRQMMLGCGAAAGPLFLVTVAIQEATRAGFEPMRHPLSLLSLGDPGWVQIANFGVTGLLNVMFAVGLYRTGRRARGSAVGPLLIAGHGAGLVLAGIFVRDPGGGFPPGLPTPSMPSWHHVLHGIGAVVAFASLIGACGAFARWFGSRGLRGWAAYCAGTGLVVLALLFASGVPAWESPALHAAAVVGWSWTAALAVRILHETRKVGTSCPDSWNL